MSLVDEMVKGGLSDEEILSELYTFILAVRFLNDFSKKKSEHEPRKITNNFTN